MCISSLSLCLCLSVSVCGSLFRSWSVSTVCLPLCSSLCAVLAAPCLQAVSAVAAEDGMRFMQEMMELSSQQQKEQLPPRAIQIVSHPYFGRVVLTAGPAQFGTDLSKSSTGVSHV